MNRNFKSFLNRIVPRSALIVAAEIGGVCPVLDFSGTAKKGTPTGGRAWILRLRSLLGWDDGVFPHPLFDTEYYLAANPKVRGGHCSPLLHFLLWGGFQGRQPHPLFDPEWYMSQNSDVVSCGLNPLQHYIGFGWREGRNPHPLFDVGWYQHAYPDVKAAGYDPLIHFLLWGGCEGRKPHPLFDSAWYMRRYPEVATSGLNPLVHYLLHGAVRNLNPNRTFNAALYARQYPKSIADGCTPLTHFVTGVERGAYNPHPGFPRPRALVPWCFPANPRCGWSRLRRRAPPPSHGATRSLERASRCLWSTANPTCRSLSPS